MSIIVRPNLYVPGTIIRSAEVNDDFDTIYNNYNGFIDNANIAPAAGIVVSKLAGGTFPVGTYIWAPGCTLTFAGCTITDLGTVATIDIDGGTIDGTVIGGAVPAAGTFTTLDCTSLTATTADIDGGTIDGVAINSSTIGVTTPAHGYFDNFRWYDGGANYIQLAHAAGANRTWTFQNSSDTVVGRDTTDTLTNKTLTTPTIGDFTNAQHDHENPAGGGQLDITAVFTGILPIANGGTNANTFTSGYVPYFNGTRLVDSVIRTTGGNIGIGMLPSIKLDVTDTTSVVIRGTSNQIFTSLQLVSSGNTGSLDVGSDGTNVRNTVGTGSVGCIGGFAKYDGVDATANPSANVAEIRYLTSPVDQTLAAGATSVLYRMGLTVGAGVAGIATVWCWSTGAYDAHYSESVLGIGGARVGPFYNVQNQSLGATAGIAGITIHWVQSGTNMELQCINNTLPPIPIIVKAIINADSQS